jgi:phage N-6-adenine-methyltransferase
VVAEGAAVTLARFKASNHPQQVAKRGADDAANDRRTPLWLFGPLHERHRFTVDAAASAENALLPRYWTRATNGLIQDWTTERVWCNPPFSDLRPWVEKATVAHASGCPLVVMLLPANRTEQGFWHDLIEPKRDRGKGLEVEFIRKRVRFGYPEGWEIPKKGDRPPFGCCLLTWRLA